MNKVRAHIILCFFDIGAIAACYYVFAKWNNIVQQINVSIESITLQSPIGLYLLIVVVPVIHVLSLFRWKGAAEIWANRFLIFSFLFMLVGAFYLSSCFDNKLVTAGYRYCASQSERMTFSEFKTYVRGDLKCSD